MNDYTLKISEQGLQTIVAALECYSRLGCGQFRYALESHPGFCGLDWDRQRQIESYLHQQIGQKETGIFDPKVETFTRAYEIKKEIEKAIAITHEPVMKHFSRQYDGAVYEHDYTPRFVDEFGEQIQHEIRIDIPEEFIPQLRRYALLEDWERLWKFVNEKDLRQGIRGSFEELTDDFRQLIITKPYKLVDTMPKTS